MHFFNIVPARYKSRNKAINKEIGTSCTKQTHSIKRNVTKYKFSVNKGKPVQFDFYLNLMLPQSRLQNQVIKKTNKI